MQLDSLLITNLLQSASTRIYYLAMSWCIFLFAGVDRDRRLWLLPALHSILSLVLRLLDSSCSTINGCGNFEINPCQARSIAAKYRILDHALLVRKKVRPQSLGIYSPLASLECPFTTSTLLKASLRFFLSEKVSPIPCLAGNTYRHLCPCK